MMYDIYIYTNLRGIFENKYNLVYCHTGMSYIVIGNISVGKSCYIYIRPKI